MHRSSCPGFQLGESLVCAATRVNHYSRCCSPWICWFVGYSVFSFQNTFCGSGGFHSSLNTWGLNRFLRFCVELCLEKALTQMRICQHRSRSLCWMTSDGPHFHNFNQFDLLAPSYFLSIQDSKRIADYFLDSQICYHYTSHSTESSYFLRISHSYLLFNLTRHLSVNPIHFWLFSWRNLHKSPMRYLTNDHSY